MTTAPRKGTLAPLCSHVSGDEMQPTLEGTLEPLYRSVMAPTEELAHTKPCRRRLFLVALVTLMTPRPLGAETARHSSPQLNIQLWPLPFACPSTVRPCRGVDSPTLQHVKDEV